MISKVVAIGIHLPLMSNCVEQKAILSIGFICYAQGSRKFKPKEDWDNAKVGLGYLNHNFFRILLDGVRVQRKLG